MSVGTINISGYYLYHNLAPKCYVMGTIDNRFNIHINTIY